MTELLVETSSTINAIPLIILTNQELPQWLSKQDSLTQNWLKNTNFSGNDFSLIPDNLGQLAKVLLVTDKVEHCWSCGELVNQLPEGQYLLQGEDALLKAAAFSWVLGAYKFDRYRESNKVFPQLVLPKAILDEVKIQARSITLVRDLINTPAGDMMPQNIAETVENLAAEFNATVNQIIGDELLEQNYPTIHMVGRASTHAPRLIDLSWGDEDAPKVTLIGKGVCFDSGGLDLKPASGMRLMKKDMGGAAHVIGLAHQIMASKLPVRLRVLIPAVENAVSGSAFRPGDVIKTRKGLTVEIDNTDAEGRLVLCDAIAEANNDKPEVMIDFATLTGAMRIALGTELPGFFSNDDTLAQQLTEAGLKVEDPVWRMPLYQPYKELFSSDIADMTNCGRVPQGGAITAALYLEAFVEEGISWTHFDIMGWNSRKQAGRPIGGEAFGIRATFEYLKQRFS